METTLCLIRHGDTDWNREGRAQGREDIALNATGFSQAERVAARLSREPWEALYASPLRRAYQTAERIAAATGLSIQTDLRLQERHMGAAAGLTAAEREARFPGLKLDQIPGTESREDLSRRVLAVLTEIATRHPGGRVLVVSHGAAINSLIVSQLGRPVMLPNTSVTWAAYSGGSWRLTAIGDAAHLEDAAD